MGTSATWLKSGALLGLLGFAETALAGAPGWIGEVPVRDGRRMFPAAEVVGLLHRRAVEVKSSGKRRVVENHLYEIRRPGPDAMQVESYWSAGHRKLLAFHGWRIPRGDRPHAYDELVSLEGADVSAYSDTWLRLLAVKDLASGDLAAFEIEFEEELPLLRFDRFSIPAEHPVARTEYLLRLPEGWSCRAVHRSTDGEVEPLRPAPVGGGWTLWAVDSIATEATLLPRAADMPTDVLVFYDGPDGDEDAIRSWKDVSSWYEAISRGAFDGSERLASVPGLGPAGNSDSARVVGIARAVRDRVRYEQVYLGDGGFRPHRAVDVWDKRWGDCKDMSHLLIAFLRLSGVEAHPVLVATSGRAYPPFPTPFVFDHCIVAVPRALRGCDYLFLDPTAKSVPVGRLPEPDEGAAALLIGTCGDTALIELPLSLPEQNTSDYEAEFVLQGGTTLTGSVRERHTGQNAFRRRQILMNESDGDRHDWLCRQALVRAPRARVGPASFSGLEADSESLVIEYSVEIPGAVTSAAGKLVVRADPLTGHHDRTFAQERRKIPVDFGAPYQVFTAVRVVVPAGWIAMEAPAPLSFENSIGTYQRTVAIDEHWVRWIRREEILTTWVEETGYPDLQAWDAAVFSGDRERVLLRRQ